MLGKTEGKRRMGQQRMRRLGGHEFEQAEGNSGGQRSLVCCLAWKIPWTEGPGGLQSMGSLGVGHD